MKFKKVFFILIFFGFVFLILFFSFLKSDKTEGSDLKIGVVTDKGLEIIEISRDRKIINILKIDGNMQFWIPGGLGWYKSNRIKKILKQEYKKNLDIKIFFYNLGFIPDKILYLGNFDDWKKSKIFLKNFGIKKWLQFEYFRRNCILNEEYLNGYFIDEQNGFLNDNMIMEFADSKAINSEMVFSIINTTAESGFANFVSDRLGWSGFSVVSTENSGEKKEKCLIKIGDEIGKIFLLKTFEGILDCRFEKDENLDREETEIYLGDDLAQMLKYSSYKRF